MKSTVHIAGAGLAGLACATRLAEAGRRVVLHESAPQAGGRCRSFHDATLDRMVDNGSHMMLSGNRAVLAYARRIGSAERLVPVCPAAFPFLDLRNGDAWTLRPGGLWPFDPARRVPGTRGADYLPALRLLLAGPTARVADVLRPGTVLHDRLWETLVVSAMNGRPERVSARLFAAVLRETLLRGESACRPLLAPNGLGAALVEPALAFLRGKGAEIRFGARVDSLDLGPDRVAGFTVAGQAVRLEADDRLVLALPPRAVARLLPGIAVPPPGQAIVNAHFRLDRPPALPGGLPFLGLVGGTAEWLFSRDEVLSVTVSAADSLAVLPTDALAARLWADCARALGLGDTMPPVRIVKEKRATFDQTPDSAAQRPTAATAWDNLALAGDWTATGLPATLEGAVRSGDAAAGVVLTAGAGRFLGAPRRTAFPLPRRGHI